MLTVLRFVVFGLLGCLGQAVAAPPSHVKWVDDFLGLQVDNRYSQVVTGTGVIDVATFTGGAVRLWTGGSGPGIARLRFGEDPGTSGFNVRNWNPTKKIVYEARVFFNLNTNMQATVGLVGLNDPDNVLAAVYESSDPQWYFEATSTVAGTQYYAAVPTEFLHTPGEWVDFMITTTGGANPSASLYIDGVLVATVDSPAVPSSDLCAEFQLWNRPVGGAWSQATMWVDWLSISQKR